MSAAVRTAIARAQQVDVVRHPQGMRPHEIEGLEVALGGARLPASYRAFCEEAGWHGGLLLSSFWLPAVFGMRDHFLAAAERDLDLAAALGAGPWWPFRWGEHGVLWWLAGEGDDPAVWERHPGRRERLRQVAPGLASALQLLTDYAAAWHALPAPGRDWQNSGHLRRPVVATFGKVTVVGDADPEWPWRCLTDVHADRLAEARALLVPALEKVEPGLSRRVVADRSFQVSLHCIEQDDALRAAPVADRVLASLPSYRHRR